MNTWKDVYTWLGKPPTVEDRLVKLETDISLLVAGVSPDLYARNEIKKLKIQIEDLKNELFGSGVSER